MKKKNIRFNKNPKKEEVAEILCMLKKSVKKFAIFDIYYPSPSDPGAYICYSDYDVKSNIFYMTLGNHGWSGGIYKIREEVVLQQLYHLALTVNDFEIRIKGAAFFAHYKNEYFFTTK